MNKIKILNEVDIKQILNMDIAINAVEKAYCQKNSGKGNVWPLVFYEYEHNIFDLDIRSGNLDDSNAYGLKLISYNENNTKLGLNKVNATSLICDSKTGSPIALLNAAPITSYRTGAAAGIGAKYLARKDSKNLLVVGCGNIAIYSIVAILITVPSIEKVIISNPKDSNAVLERIDKIKEEVERILLESNHKLNAEIIGTTNLEESVKESDIIITATPSEKAMIDVNWVKEGTHFSCMGACMEGKQEIDEKILRKAIIYCDGGLLFDTVLLSMHAKNEEQDLEFDSYEEYNKDKKMYGLDDKYCIIGFRSYGDIICVNTDEDDKQVYLLNIETGEFDDIWCTFIDWVTEEIDTAIQLIAEKKLEPIQSKIEE